MEVNLMGLQVIEGKKDKKKYYKVQLQIPMTGKNTYGHRCKEEFIPAEIVNVELNEKSIGDQFNVNYSPSQYDNEKFVLDSMNLSI